MVGSEPGQVTKPVKRVPERVQAANQAPVQAEALMVVWVPEALQVMEAPQVEALQAVVAEAAHQPAREVAIKKIFRKEIKVNEFFK